MRIYVSCIALTLACWLVLTSRSSCDAQTPSAADCLPATTMLYLEAAEAQSFVDLPLGRQLLANPLFQELWRGPEAMKLRGGITLAEIALGERVPAALVKVANHGAVLAVDSKTRGVVLLAHTQDKATCGQLLGKLVQLARTRDKNQPEGNSVKETNYRGQAAYEVNQVVMTSFDDWLLATNNSELAKTIVDNYRASAAQGLSAVPAFAASRDQLRADGPSKRLLWAWADLAELKSQGVASDLFKRPDENFVAELVLGGLLATVREAATVSAELTSQADHLRLSATMRDAASLKQPEYEFFFGKEAQGTAPVPVELDGGLFTLAAYRDVADLWRRAGDLFGQQTNDQLAVADATLTTLFSGKDFGEEILGAIEPGVQIVAAAQDFSDQSAPTPSIKLPAFALITKLREPDQMQPQLRRIFMSLVGFLNITGAMNQQPQLDVETLREGNGTYVLATYVPDKDRPADWAVPIQFNFSPTLAIVDEYAVLASTGTIARKIVHNLQAGAASADAAGAGPAGAVPSGAVPSGSAQASRLNTVLRLQGAPIAEALTSNREQMISQNMLEKGHTQEEAAREIDTLLRLAGLAHSLEVTLSVGPGVQLDADLRLNP